MWSLLSRPLALQDLLRGQWAFDGYVVSDCGAVDDIVSEHLYNNTLAEGAAAALTAGTDADCGSAYNALNESLAQVPWMERSFVWKEWYLSSCLFDRGLAVLCGVVAGFDHDRRR